MFYGALVVEEMFRSTRILIILELKTEEDYDIKEKAILKLVQNYSKNQ